MQYTTYHNAFYRGVEPPDEADEDDIAEQSDHEEFDDTDYPGFNGGDDDDDWKKNDAMRTFSKCYM